MTLQVSVGGVLIGGGSPVSIQSMTNTSTSDIEKTLEQIISLAERGCDIVRLAVPNKDALYALDEIIDKSPVPLIADIHFDYRLALGSIKSGISGIRINPGNIGDEKKIRLLAEKAGDAGIPIRVGANFGSLPKEIKENLLLFSETDERKADALVEAAARQCSCLEKYNFKNIKVSLKSSSVPVTVKAYRKFSNLSDYPLHLGVTEAGSPEKGIVKSSIGIGSLLLDQIGDTIRVSLTAPPVREVDAALNILEAVGIRKAYPEIISCPTCGRTEFDLIKLCEFVENLVADIKSDGKRLKIKKIAVMGCVVNGPGEASDAELGLAGAKGGNLSVFLKGESIGVFEYSNALELFKKELKKYK